MEYCDRATLRHAMKKGVFHKRLDNTSVAVDLCAIVQVLIEVAQAIQHLHSLKLIHCDIKWVWGARRGVQSTVLG